MSRQGDEGVQALEWAYTLLTGDAALAAALTTAHGVVVEVADLPQYVWEGVAPVGAPEPFLVLSVSEALDHPAVGAVPRLFTSVPLNAKVTGQGPSYDRLAPIARAAYAALIGRTNDPLSDGGQAITAYRTGSIQYPEQAEGIEYRHLGHMLTVEID